MARWYDPWLGRFIQPDPIVPDPSNPQALNRYSSCLNDPVNHTDPSGYDPLDAQWSKDFRSVHGRDPGAVDEAIRLFSLAYMDEWFSQDLGSKFYNADHTVNEEFLINCFHAPPASRSWDTMAGALASLAGFYNEDEERAFVRDVAFLYAGMAGRSQNTGLRPYWAVGKLGSNEHLYIQEGTIDRSLVEATVNGRRDPDANVHHWAWAFAAGYNVRTGITSGVNAVREYRQGSGPVWNRSVDQSDVKLGSLGAQMGSALRTKKTGYAQIPALFQDYLGVGRIP